MRKVCRRLSSKTGTIFTHAVSTASDAVILTNKEKQEISSLKFFTGSNFESSSLRRTVAKQKYLNNKLPVVKKIFGDDPKNPGYLSAVLPKEMPNPYLDAHARVKIDSETGDRMVRGKARLSVTRLLTKRWCELREAYDIYASIPIYEHRQVLEGTAKHQKLEDETHPISEEWQNFVKDFEIVIPQDPFHELAGSWNETTAKMVNLFVDGEAREVLCHGFVNSDSCKLIKGPVKGEDDVLISGIIDHLILKKKSCTNIAALRLRDSIMNSHTLDIAEILSKLQKSRALLKDKYEVVVSDVKTRTIRRIPTQDSVLKSTKLQVMYYRNFMEALGVSPLVTYQNLLVNAKRRGFDADTPLDPAKVISIMAASDLITSDMRRLRNGDDIGFEPYDDFYFENSGGVAYDMSSYHDMITDLRVIEKFDEFFTVWSRPVTLRYFAARLAQMYHEVAPLLSDLLLIEYYHGGDNFQNVSFCYDSNVLDTECLDGAKFWFGKRGIEPIKPCIKNFMTYCRYCDYEDVCSWKKQGSEMCQNLGRDLTKVTSPQNAIEGRPRHHEPLVDGKL